MAALPPVIKVDDERKTLDVISESISLFGVSIERERTSCLAENLHDILGTSEIAIEARGGLEHPLAQALLAAGVSVVTASPAA